MTIKFAVFCFAATTLLAGCNTFSSSQPPVNPADEDQERKAGTHMFYHNGEKVFGEDDKPINGTRNASTPGGISGGGGVGVNSFLWRASLDTIAFMPVASADPFGGVIITEWYTPPDSPNERFKLNIFVLGKELRADGVRASVFRQKRDASGQWADAPVDGKTGTDLENEILTRARQMRLATASN